MRIFMYRNAKQALEWINEGERAMKRFQEQPGVMQLLLQMHRAQFGTEITEEELVARLTEGRDGG